jgi:hypothetical protein
MSYVSSIMTAIRLSEEMRSTMPPGGTTTLAPSETICSLVEIRLTVAVSPTMAKQTPAERAKELASDDIDPRPRKSELSDVAG